MDVESDPATVTAVQRAFVSLLDEAPAIADRVVLALMEAHGHRYERLDPALRADFRANTRAHVIRGIRTMAGVAEPEERAVYLWRETGRLRARQGEPLEAVMRSYTVGTRVLWEALVEKGVNEGLGIDDRVLVLAGRRLWSALDVQNAVMMESYRLESAKLERRDLRRQQSCLDALAEGRGADPEFAAEARDVLGLEAEDVLGCVVARSDGLSDEPLRSPQERLERSGVRSHWYVRAGVHFGLVVLGSSDVRGLVELLRGCAAGRVGVAPAPDGIPGFATAYRLATRAAETVPLGAHDVVSVTSRLPEVLLGASPEVTSMLVDQTIGRLLALPPAQAGPLLRTLGALLVHDGSPTHAADELYCHRNTVIYRMKQIELLTGRSLHDGRDKLLLTLGLMATGHWTRQVAAHEAGMTSSGSG